LPPCLDGGVDSNKEGFSRKKKNAQFRSASAEAFWIEAAFFVFRLKPSIDHLTSG
jgi:hypothetical protein